MLRMHRSARRLAHSSVGVINDVATPTSAQLTLGAPSDDLRRRRLRSSLDLCPPLRSTPSSPRKPEAILYYVTYECTHADR
eukprot:scaffold127499_cov31-Tisochrysis_lutea.AAC.2